MFLPSATSLSCLWETEARLKLTPNPKDAALLSLAVGQTRKQVFAPRRQEDQAAGGGGTGDQPSSDRGAQSPPPKDPNCHRDGQVSDRPCLHIVASVRVDTDGSLETRSSHLDSVSRSDVPLGSVSSAKSQPSRGRHELDFKDPSPLISHPWSKGRSCWGVQ